jgi:hypothetical protein
LYSSRLTCVLFYSGIKGRHARTLPGLARPDALTGKSLPARSAPG